ncbi:MAG: hypothetical protein K2I96_24100 [Lachnospiraceae bacterium]|nr:hypothetical protein [Lachnospiraceae bacterium]
MMNNKLSGLLEMDKSNVQDKLEFFIQNYYNYVGKLRCFAHEEPILADIIESFSSWLDIEGSDLLQTTLERLDINKEKKMEGFTEYYSFLLVGAESDIYSLVDLLYAIPSQFAKEFMSVQNTLHGSINNSEQGDTRDRNIEYFFNTQGTFEQVPYFMNMGA